MTPYELVTSASRLPHIASEISEAAWVALDLECTGLDPYTSRIRILSVNTGKGIYVIDLFQTGTLEPVIEALRTSKAVKIGQGLKFDSKFLIHNYGLELWPIFDTYCSSAIVYNGKHSGKGTHDLYALYARELGIGPEAPDMGAKGWEGVLSKEHYDYAAEDVTHLPMLRDALKPKLKADGLNKVALIEFQAIVPVARMELAGMDFDKEAWTALALSNASQASTLRRELMHELPHPKNQLALPGFDPDFNLQSTPQLLRSLHMLGLTDNNGVPIADTNEKTLAVFAKEFPVVRKLLDYRGYAQAVKTFGMDFLEHLHPVTKRMHTSFFPFTGAGRFACSDPNLQNIPRDPRFRNCFRAPPRKKFVLVDYSQIELRIAAEVAHDTRLLDVYSRGADAHAQTASLVVGVPLNEVTKAQRQVAKSINFGFVYGMSAKMFVLYAQATYGVTLTLKEAYDFRQGYFDSYSGIREWHSRVFSDESKSCGIARTIANRIRYLGKELHSEYANTPVQGSAADGFKTALWLVHHRLKKYGNSARMVHMVHDEIITEVDDDPEIIAAVKHDVEQGMVEGMQPLLKHVPVVAEGSVGSSWADK